MPTHTQQRLYGRAKYSPFQFAPPLISMYLYRYAKAVVKTAGEELMVKDCLKPTPKGLQHWSPQMFVLQLVAREKWLSSCLGKDCLTPCAWRKHRPGHDNLLLTKDDRQFHHCGCHTQCEGILVDQIVQVPGPVLFVGPSTDLLQQANPALCTGHVTHIHEHHSLYSSKETSRDIH